MTTVRTSRVLGGAGAVLAGALAFVTFPTLGIAEALLGAWVLASKSAVASVAAAFGSGLLLCYGILILATTAVASPLVVVFIVLCGLTAMSLVLGGPRRFSAS